MKYIIHTDGGARGNPGPAAAAAVIHNQDKGVTDTTSIYLGKTTNNVAEYKAVELALEWFSKNNQPKSECEIEFYLDSLLVTSQLNEKFKIKNETLKQSFTRIKQLLKEFKKVSFSYVPRSQNTKADELVNITLDENKEP